MAPRTYTECCSAADSLVVRFTNIIILHIAKFGIHKRMKLRAHYSWDNLFRRLQLQSEFNQLLSQVLSRLEPAHFEENISWNRSSLGLVQSRWDLSASSERV